MSNKNKLARFAEMDTFPNVFQNTSFETPAAKNYKGETQLLSGNWARHFNNQNPITLELACGKGDYTRGLAGDFAQRNFIGIDIKGNRMWVGAKEALDKNMQNVAFLRTQIEHLDHFFAPKEVSEIWITFPDPQLGKPKKRLTSPRYLDLYKKVVADTHFMHLKTDSPELYEYTLETLNELKLPILYQNDDIYARELDFPELRHHTFYEQMHLENKKTIKYIRWQLF